MKGYISMNHTWKNEAKLLANKGLTMSEIANEVGISYSSVAKWIKKNNINVKSGVHKEWHKKVIELSATHTLVELSKIVDQSENNIQSYLFRYGIKTKSVIDQTEKTKWQSRARVLASEHTATEIAKILNVPIANLRYFFKINNINCLVQKKRESPWHNEAIKLAPTHTTYEISTMFNVSQKQVQAVLRENNITAKKVNKKTFKSTIKIDLNKFDNSTDMTKYLYSLGLSDLEISQSLNISKQRVQQIRSRNGLTKTSSARKKQALLNKKSLLIDDINFFGIQKVADSHNISKAFLIELVGKNNIKITKGTGAKTNRTPEWWQEMASQHTVYELSDITGLKITSVRATLGKLHISAKRATGIRKGQLHTKSHLYFGKSYEELVDLGKEHTMKEIVTIINGGSENSIRAAYKRMKIPYKRAY